MSCMHGSTALEGRLKPNGICENAMFSNDLCLSMVTKA